MILRGKAYDGVKIVGKWVLPLALIVLPLAQAFVDKGDFSTPAIMSAVIAALMVVANFAQTRSKLNYTAEQEAAGVVTVNTATEGIEGTTGNEGFEGTAGAEVTD